MGRGKTGENNQRGKVENREIGQIIMGSLAALALLFGVIVIFNSRASIVADPRFSSTTSNPTK